MASSSAPVDPSTLASAGPSVLWLEMAAAVVQHIATGTTGILLGLQGRAIVPTPLDKVVATPRRLNPANWMIDLHQKFDFHEAVEVCGSWSRRGRSASRTRFAKSSSGPRSRSCGC